MFTANGPAIVAELRGGFLDADLDQLRTIAHPTLLVAGKDSPAPFAEVTKLMADAIPRARLEWVEGGHLVNPAHPVVLGFVRGISHLTVARSANRVDGWSIDAEPLLAPALALGSAKG
jgi:pimeloyl-ACP methyl ester carboxylesterase